MKAFLLAAGHGTRLRPITDSIPKCLVPIRGKPLLGIWFELLRRYGIHEVLVNVHCHADAVREYVTGQNQGLEIRVFEEPELLGSAGTIATNGDWVRSDPSFWVLFADVLTNANLDDMFRFHCSKGRAITLGIYEVPDPKRCGIVELDREDVIRRFIEKPSDPIGKLAFSGLLLGTPELLDAIPPGSPVDLGSGVLPRLTGRMVGYRIQDYLLDVGTKENYSLAQKTWPSLTTTV